MKSTSFFWKIVLTATLLLALLISSCVIDPDPDPDDDVRNHNYRASEEFDFSIDINAQTRLDIDATNGTVEILAGADNNRVQIWGERRVESDSYSDAEYYLSKLAVDVTQYADEIAVKTIQPDNTRGRNFLVFYHIRIPRNWQVRADQQNGEVLIEGIGGPVDVTQNNGETVLRWIDNDLNAALDNGNIFVSHLSGSADINLINGNIDAALDLLPAGGACKLTSVNGQILLAIPRSTSAEFSAAVTNGTIAINNLNLRNAQTTPTRKTGTLGTGDGNVELKTINGNIVVNGVN